MYATMAALNIIVLLIMTVLNVSAQSTDGQSYLIALQHLLLPPANYNLTAPQPSSNTNITDADLFNEQADNNTRLTLYKNTVVQKSNELSQTAMDVITIVWYVATFLALAAFFMLMACSDRRCRDVRNSQNAVASEAQRAPPTPSPSYSEFAPPSYDTVIKMQHQAKTSIFVIPFNAAETMVGNKASPEGNTNQSTCNVYTVNELQKTPQ